MKRFVICLFSLIYLSTTQAELAQAELVNTNRYEGFVYFEDQNISTKDPVQTDEKPIPSEEDLKNLQGKWAVEALEKMVQEVKELQAESLLDPTNEQKLVRFRKANNAWVNRNFDFGKSWEKTNLSHPELLYQGPGSNLQARANQFVENTEAESKLKEIASQWGLVFVFKSSCFYSQEQARILKQHFADKDWTVMSLSIDGNGFDVFPNYISKPEIAKELNISRVPALFLMNGETGEMKPIAWGLVSEEEIQENILLHFEEKKS